MSLYGLIDQDRSLVPFSSWLSSGNTSVCGRLSLLIEVLVPTFIGIDAGQAGALLSDDGGHTFSPSTNTLPGGGEGTIALAPNSSLILNTRATQNLRFQSASTDQGRSFSRP